MNYTIWGHRELVEELGRRDQTHSYIIAKAHQLLKTHPDEKARDLLFYLEAHAKDALEKWGSNN